MLSEFRTRLLAHEAERDLFEAVLERARQRELLSPGGRQRTDSTHVLGAVRAMARVEIVTETLRHALNVLAAEAPGWLRTQTGPEWASRYGSRASEYRLPKSKAKRQAWAEETGADGMTLLAATYAQDAPPELQQLPAVQLLRQVWIQNFIMEEGQVRWRGHDDIPPSGCYIGSPYDTEMRYAYKGAMVWSGYKVHLTETCTEGRPNLITNVETTAAAVADDAVTEHIHTALEGAGLLPEKHIADTGFVNAKLIVDSRDQYRVKLIGPTRRDNAWQAKAGAGFAARDFTFDWQHKQATCPAGKVSRSWTPAIDRFKNEVIKIKFATADCRACAVRDQCTRSVRSRRTVTVRPQAQHEVLQASRGREATEAFKQEYARRAGVEGTIAQGVRSCGLRRTRYRGEAKTHLQHLMTATAMNVVRLVRWLDGESKAATPVSAFARLYLVTA